MLAATRSLVTGAAQLCRLAAAAAMALLTAIVIYTVTMRFALAQVPYWSEELPRLLLVWGSLLATAYNTAVDRNLNAGLLHFWPAGQAQAMAYRIRDALSLVFMIVLLVAGWQISAATWDVETTALRVPSAVLYIMLPVAAAVATAALAVAVLAPRARA